jgi:hypothetical protein
MIQVKEDCLQGVCRQSLLNQKLRRSIFKIYLSISVEYLASCVQVETSLSSFVQEEKLS